MIRIASQPEAISPPWHEVFLRMVPAIRRHARIAFRYLDPENRAECIQEAVCNACCAVARLAERNKLNLCYPSVMARFAVAQVRDGRKVGGRSNCQDISSEHCQRQNCIHAERIDHFDEDEDAWEEAVIQDTRRSPVPEIVAFRVDFNDWLKTLSRRDSRIAAFLALGNRTADAARKFRVSESRISQLRRELAEAWEKFVGEPSLSGAVVAIA
jgi:hypothetical protein